MLIVSYDISDNKMRTQFSKFIKKFGYRLQYSVFKIENSDRILNNIISEVNKRYAPKFDENDSIFIFDLSKQCKIYTYGYAVHEDESLIFVE